LDFIRLADHIFSVLTYKQLILFTILTQWQNSKKLTLYFNILKLFLKIICVQNLTIVFQIINMPATPGNAYFLIYVVFLHNYL